MKTLVITMIVGIALSLPALAATQTVTLSVPGMNCAACPVTIKAALSRVEGVEEVEVKYPEREVTVTYDDTAVSIKSLTRATANAGYPSELME